MARRRAPKSQITPAPILDFLAEFADYLLAAGIKNRRFAAMMRLAFFQAASANAKFSNERLNQSSVAAMTGLTRLQVRKFAKQPPLAPPGKPDGIENVVDGWTSDGRFTARNRTPKRLPITGRGITFESLAHKYGGDIPHRAVLREMQRNGFVTIRDGHVSLRRAVRKTQEEARLSRLSRALGELLRGPRSEPHAALRTLNIEISYPSASEKGRTLMHKRTAEGLSAFLDRVQAAGVAASIESAADSRRKARVSRTRVILLTEELEK